jgi:nucleotide-binding universal stress UspA family protein
LTRHEAVRLVHVVPSFFPVASMVPTSTVPDLGAAGAAILERDAARAAAAAPGLDVSVALRTDDMVAAFRRETEHASCLVVGTRAHHWGVGSTTALAVLGSRAPVIAVPAAPDGTRDASGPVVAAASHPREIEHLVEAAVEEAWVLGTGVEVLHAWRRPDLYDYAAGSHDVAQRWQDQVERQLCEATAGVRSDHPETRVQVRARLVSPRLAVAEAARDAALLVMGRHHAHQRLWANLGGVVAAALHARRSPVMVVPQGC